MLNNNSRLIHDQASQKKAAVIHNLDTRPEKTTDNYKVTLTF